jgi:hypothetical protein
VTGRIDPGFVKLRFTGRRTMHLSMSDLSIFPGPEGQSTLEMAAQYSLTPHPLFPQVVFAWCRRFGPEILESTSEPLSVRASVAGGAEADGAKTCSGFDHRPLSGFGHRSYVGR